MQITPVAKEALKSTFRIVIDANDITREMESELKALGQKVKIPGFRPGNVPLKVLQQRYGKNIQGDVLKNVINNAATKVVEDNKLKPAMQPDVKVEEYKEDKDLTFTITIESLPDVPALNYSDITLEREAFEVDDAEVDEALTKFAERNPKVAEQPAATKAADGDVVTMDFVGKADGKVFDGGTAEKFSIEIGSGRLIDDFEQQLIGLKAGDEKLVKVTFPKNYFNKELAGQPATFDVKVISVSKLETPEADDQFAKDRGFADLRALKEAIRNQLLRDYQGAVRTRVKKRLFDVLEKKCDYPLPERMVDLEFNAIWTRLLQAKDQNPAEDVFEGRKEDEVKDEYRKIAERRVRLGILLADIGSSQNIQVGREEMTRAIMDQAQQFPGQEQAIFDFYRKNPSRLDELRGPILEEKAVDWILDQVKMKDLKVTTKELQQVDEDENTSSTKASPKKKASKKKSGDGDNE